MTARKEPVRFYNADNAKPAGEKQIQKWGCMLNSSTAVMLFLGALSLGSRAGQQPELSDREHSPAGDRQPLPAVPGAAGCHRALSQLALLLDAAVRWLWLSWNTCDHEDVTIRLHLKRSLHPLRFCYSKLLATGSGTCKRFDHCDFQFFLVQK